MMAREDMTTLSDFYDEIKAEKSAVVDNARQSNRRSFTPPETTAEARQQQAAQIENEFEARRSVLRQSIQLQQLSGQIRMSARASAAIDSLNARMSSMQGRNPSFTLGRKSTIGSARGANSFNIEKQ